MCGAFGEVIGSSQDPSAIWSCGNSALLVAKCHWVSVEAPDSNPV